MIEKCDVISIREYFPSLENPSSSTWVYNQAKGIKELGINIIVISPTPKIPTIIKNLYKNKYAWRTKPSKNIENFLGVDVLRPSYFKLPDKYFLDLNIRNLERCLISNSQFQPKIIHAHFGNMGVAALKLQSMLKIPLITSFYGFDIGSDKEILKPYYDILKTHGDLFLVLSSDMRNDLIKLGFPETKIVIHHLGVDTNYFTPNFTINDREKFVFTIVAGFSERKGIHFAIQAFIEFLNKEKINNCELRIVGDGYYKPVLLKLAQNQNNIVFHNNYIVENPREFVKREIQNCDVFILTSTTVSKSDKEGTPIVLMEAQACGKPCISSHHAGIPEVVLDNYTGILVAEGDIKGIINAMRELYYNTEKRISFGLNARTHIEEKFSMKTEMTHLSQIYKAYLK